MLILAMLVTTTHAFADGSSKNASKASKHSVLAIAHGTAFSAKVASGVIAVPLLVVGSVGIASAQAGTALMKNAVENAPLVITEITVTADPAPEVIMKSAEKDNK